MCVACIVSALGLVGRSEKSYLWRSVCAVYAAFCAGPYRAVSSRQACRFSRRLADACVRRCRSVRFRRGMRCSRTALLRGVPACGAGWPCLPRRETFSLVSCGVNMLLLPSGRERMGRSACSSAALTCGLRAMLAWALGANMAGSFMPLPLPLRCRLRPGRQQTRGRRDLRAAAFERRKERRA